MASRLITGMARRRKRALKPSLTCLLTAAALLVTGCERREMTREDAIAAAEAHVRGEGGRDPYPRDRYPRVAYERRSTWLVHYMSDGGAGGTPTLEIDKMTGKVVLATSGQ